MRYVLGTAAAVGAGTRLQGEELLFIPGRTNRSAGMRLRNSGLATITVGKKKLRAYRLDMSRSDPLARMSWPHVYRYWFFVESFRFLVYEGRMADNRISRTEYNPAN
jgi:hypothetical protein